MPLLQVLQLGLTDYGTALKLQETLVNLRKQGLIADTLLLLEHPPVITMGRNSKQENVVASPEYLARHGVETFEVNRGGDVTFHGHGQLVGYPICDLRGFVPKLGAVEFVRRLEESLIRACAEFGIPTQRVCGLTGVWTTRAEQSSERKIAAIGVHISRGITSHGFALNVTTDLDFFSRLIIPCGIADKPVTSMAAELGSTKVPTLEAVSNALTRQFGSVFGVQVLWLESLDALLKSGALAPEAEPPNLNQDLPLQEPEDLHKMREELGLTPRDDIYWA